MKLADYEDERGRKYRVKLPDSASVEDAEMGIPIGPPDVVEALMLPEPFATRLHNMLFDHQLWNINAVRKKPKLLFNLLQRALKVDVQLLMHDFRELERD